MLVCCNLAHQYENGTVKVKSTPYQYPQSQPSTQNNSDVLIIGSGAAGLTLALSLADQCKINLICKEHLTESATFYAQGGISAVLDKNDSIEAHVEDTLNAGAGLCNERIVRKVVSNGPQSIRWLSDQGVCFTQINGNQNTGKQYHLTREGGHRHRRIVHAADATGREMEISLAKHAINHPNITIHEKHIAIDLITGRKLGRKSKRCLGAYILDKTTDKVGVFGAKMVVLATGGAGKVYLYTSNPDIASGDGIAMAWRAGCRIANMEFIQFHPTCLFHPQAKSFLITEAIRGEGGRLRTPNDNKTFMSTYDTRAELAPRDVVARAIDHVMKKSGAEFVHLDISHKSKDFILQHFPNIYARCLDFGYDMATQAIPVVPAAHYTCGGIMSDAYGRTDIEGLYALGETAHTGMHGANRMASNSLLECIVFAAEAARNIAKTQPNITLPERLPEWDESRVTDSDEEVVVTHNWHELRQFMWDYVGIVRTDKRLQRAKRRVELLLTEINDYYNHFRVSSDLIELRNLAVVSDLIIRSAMLRKESRGLHYTADYPELDHTQPPKNTILTPDNYT
ncbi:MAG: L-aspartate oxidase [Gammaproteobacteria bacterium]|nr:L-aspartate oxidase [Gammaproteobacteria bacterium]